jgi:hypothetical protein
MNTLSIALIVLFIIMIVFMFLIGRDRQAELVLENKRIIQSDTLNDMSLEESESIKNFYYEMFLKVLDNLKITNNAIKKIYCVYKSCEHDSVEEVINRAIVDYGGTSIEKYVTALSIMLAEITFNAHKGLHADWCFKDDEIEQLLNKIFAQYGYIFYFTDHDVMNPFDIKLIEEKTQNIIENRHFSYSDLKKRDLKELMQVINEMIYDKNFVFIDADTGSSAYVFLLFEQEQYKRLKDQYGYPFETLISPYLNPLKIESTIKN